MVNVQYPQKSNFGVLTATEVRTPIVNNPAGNLLLQYMGTSYLEIRSGLVMHNGMLFLNTGKQIKDSNSNILLDPDETGNIATLAPLSGTLALDGKMTTPANKQKTFLTAAGAGAVNTSGTYDETDGSWDMDADDLLFMDLLNAIPLEHIGGTVRLDKVTLFISSTHNNAYVTTLDIVAWNYVAGSSANVYTDNDDLGNGSTGRENKVYVCDLELDPAKSYIIRPSVIVGAGTISIYGVLLEWSIE